MRCRRVVFLEEFGVVFGQIEVLGEVGREFGFDDFGDLRGEGRGEVGEAVPEEGGLVVEGGV